MYQGQRNNVGLYGNPNSNPNGMYSPNANAPNRSNSGAFGNMGGFNYGGPSVMQPQGNNLMNTNQNVQDKDRQIQQLKSAYPNLQHKSINSNNQPVDLVEISLQIQTSEVNLQIPMAIVIDSRFPAIPPKIYIKSKLKHNLFEVKDQVIELDVSNILQWVPKQSTLNEIMSRAKATFERDPPHQEKIIEDVNALLSKVSEKDFKNLVNADHFSRRSVEELKQLQGMSFQELICSSNEYKNIGNNLVEVINFNEKIANDTLNKRVELEQHKQQLVLVADRIEALKQTYNEKVAKCQGFKEAFRRPQIESFIHHEIRNLDSQSSNIEASADTSHGNIFDLLQVYLDTRKNYHRLNLIKAKLPELNFQ